MPSIEELQQLKLQAEIDKIKEETAELKKSADSKSSNNALQEKKLLAEIEKLEFELTEKRKPWVSRNLAILIPSLIAVASISTGILTGYFSASAVKLENQKHDLQNDITLFKERRDTLNRRNIELSIQGDSLLQSQLKIVKANEGLIKDTSTLSFIIRSNNSKLMTFEKDKADLSKDVQGLSAQKDTLAKQIRQKNEQLEQAAFNEYFSRILLPANRSYLAIRSSEFSSLKSIITKGDKFKPVYLDKITHTIDTVTSTLVKCFLQVLMYECTGDNKWKEGLLATGSKACDEIVADDSPYGSSYYVWRIFSEVAWKDDKEKIEIVSFLTNCIKKLKSRNEDIDGVYYNITYLWGDNNEKLNLLGTIPDDFCFLVQLSRKLVLSYQLSYVNRGPSYFLEEYAPVSYVMILSDLLKKPATFISINAYDKSVAFGKMIGIIDKNSDIFINKPSDLYSSQSWETWQSQYKELTNILEDIPGKCGDTTQIKKIIGHRL